MLTPKNFKCSRCADCCKYLRVKLSDKDIDTIKKKGYDEKLFTEFDMHINDFVLKNKDENCVFLVKKQGKYHCMIYKARPETCKLYPFVNLDRVEDCKPNLMKYASKER